MYQNRRGKRTHHNQNVDQCTIYSKQNVYVSRELIVFTLCRLPRMHNYVQHTISPAARSTSHYINTIKIIIHLERVTSLIGNVYFGGGESACQAHTRCPCIVAYYSTHEAQPRVDVCMYVCAFPHKISLSTIYNLYGFPHKY